MARSASSTPTTWAGWRSGGTRARLLHRYWPGRTLTLAPASPRQARGCKLVLVDTLPAVSGIVAAAIAVADLVVIPVQATPDDLRAVGVTVQAAEAGASRCCSSSTG